LKTNDKGPKAKQIQIENEIDVKWGRRDTEKKR